VNSIALQADLFAKGGMITSPIFSNINREPDGVHFALTGIVNPAGINFLQLVTNALAAAQQQVQQEQQQTPFTETPQAPSESGTQQ
jgi:hypothetical protein